MAAGMSDAGRGDPGAPEPRAAHGKCHKRPEKGEKCSKMTKMMQKESAHQDDQKARTGEFWGARAHRDLECLFSAGKAHDCIEAVGDCAGKPSVKVLSLEQRVVFSIFLLPCLSLGEGRAIDTSQAKWEGSRCR